MKNKTVLIGLLGLLTFISCNKNDTESIDVIYLITNDNEKIWHLDSTTFDGFSEYFFPTNECVSDDVYLFKSNWDLNYNNKNTELKGTTFGMTCIDSLIIEEGKWEIFENNQLIIFKDTLEIFEISKEKMILRKHTGNLPSNNFDSIPLYNYKCFISR